MEFIRIFKMIKQYEENRSTESKKILIKFINNNMMKVLDTNDIIDIELLKRDNIGFKVTYNKNMKEYFLKVCYHATVNQISLYNGMYEYNLSM